MSGPERPGGDFIDWETAVRVGSRLVGEGPITDRAEAERAVAELRAGAERSTGLVREFTGLEAPEGTAPVLVIDRHSWVRANAESFQTVLGPVVSTVMAKREPGAMTRAVGARITGAEIGLLLGFMGSRVLGQFDPFHQPHGRLLLVAPNVVHVERELGADPTDFRLWVCLHEETHRVQFTAVPWMRDHLLAQVERLAETLVPDQETLEDGLRNALATLRGGSLLDAISSPEQRAVVDEVTGMMSLLEGHADVVMDGVGPEVIPSVAAIRRKFTERRKGIGPLDRILRRLLGLDAKMAQYRDGAAFVRQVVDTVGMADFNAVWSGPEHLPSKDEIHDPDSWIRRVHG